MVAAVNLDAIHTTVHAKRHSERFYERFLALLVLPPTERLKGRDPFPFLGCLFSLAVFFAYVQKKQKSTVFVFMVQYVRRCSSL